MQNVMALGKHLKKTPFLPNTKTCINLNTLNNRTQDIEETVFPCFLCKLLSKVVK